MRRRTKKGVRRPPKGGPFDDTPPVPVDAVPHDEVPRNSVPPIEFPSGPPKRRPSVLPAAIAVSALIHLSMVTLFRIVIYFPGQDLTYYDMYIVEATPRPAAAQATGSLRTSLLANALNGDFELEAPMPSSKLEGIRLPTLEFAELDRLRIREASALGADRQRALFGAESPDSWARFGLGLRQVGRSLSGLRLRSGQEKAIWEEDAPAPQVVRPAPGYRGHLKWDAKPHDRRLLFTPPARAFWEAGTQDLGTVEIVLEVNPNGRVVNVWSPTVDETGLVDSMQMTAIRYRFEPLDTAGGGNQMATLRIQAVDAAP